MLSGLIFDFDGLILDTETPEYTSWMEVYHRYGCEFPIDIWGKIVGGNGASSFDPLDYLASLTGLDLDREKIEAAFLERSHALISEQKVLTGVIPILNEARGKNIKLAVASSSPHSWVDNHLDRLGLFEFFDAVVCADDVVRTKPDPALFIKALQKLEIEADQAVVFEDSPNGILAAKKAEIFCVCVPNPVTEKLDLRGADMRLGTLSEISVSKLLGILDSPDMRNL